MGRTNPQHDAEQPGFAIPDAGHRPGVRWWWPGGAVSGPQIEREIRTLREAGFSRAEIALLPLGLPEAMPSDAIRTWGTPAFSDRLREALIAARRHGMRIDLTVTPGWPLASPATAGDSIHLAQRKLVGGSHTIAGGTTIDTLPEPEGGPADGDHLVAVTAARLATAEPDDAGTILLDEETATDLTHRVSGGALRWTAPGDGTWLVFSFWSRPTGQRSLAEAGVQDALVIDHFSAEAAAAAIEHIDRYVLPADLDPLLAEVGGDIFEDSLELAADGELWTADLLNEFARRRGYDLTPYLPAIRVEGLFRFDWEMLLAGINPESPPAHDFPDRRGRRIRHDYYRTLNELYADNHIAPLTRWANGRGLRYRAQPYGNIMDHVELAGSVQVPESEDLVNWIASGGMTGEGAAAYETALDFHRGIAAAAHMTGAPVVSLECCAVLDADYQTDLAALKRHVDTAFSAGVNQLVLHGVPYQDVPGAHWPGWAPFSGDGTPAVSDAWGPRQPMWRHIRAYTDYLARMSTVLRHGRPQVDVAVYRQAYWCLAWPKITDPGLADAGFTYEFLSPSLLEHPAAVVHDGRLAPERAGYRALIVADEPAMELRVLDRIREIARQGLPVVFVGAPPHRAQGFRDADGQDREVEQSAARLLALPNVRLVTEQKQITQALDELGVRPDAELRGASGVVTVHRQGTGGDFYHLFNMGTGAVRFTADLRGTGTVRILDPWRGTSHSMPAVQTAGRRSVVLDLGPGETTVVHLGSGTGLGAWAVSTPATVVPRTVRWERELTDWNLEVLDWQPHGVECRRRSLPLPADWRTLDGLADASGVGIYRSTVVLPTGWSRGTDAVLLELGLVAGSVRVEVNDQPVPVDCATGRAPDVRPYLHDGANSVLIEVATTLGNRLVGLARSGDATYRRFADRSSRPAGLLGPVRLYGATVAIEPAEPCVNRGPGRAASGQSP
ncbi:glycosyl hydrolase [Micromonospora sp. DT229]|uniref:glycosyl hydrolase n=1 Tax=Micromonospora sp. DT229 TaxID=3393430 RepID=UPI003CF4B7BF